MTQYRTPEYIAKVKLLSHEEIERLLSRMGDKLPRLLEKCKVSQEEALATQLELEDEQLQEWRKMMHLLKKKEKSKSEEKPKIVKKSEASIKDKVVEKSKVPALKSKAPTKAKVVKKSNPPTTTKAAAKKTLEAEK
jgi:hypothetical protein